MGEAGEVEANDDGTPDGVSARRIAWRHVARGTRRGLMVPGLPRDAREDLEEVLDASEVAGELKRGRLLFTGPRRVLRILAFMLAVLCVGGALTVARDQWLNPYTPRVDARSLPPKADRELSQSLVPDPVDDIDWGMRVYNELRTGKRCVVLGQLAAGRLGRAAGGQFRAFGPRPTAYCKKRGQQSMVIIRTFAVAPDGVRTVVFGIVDHSVQRIGIGLRAPGKTLAIGPDDGTLLYVVTGIDALAGFKQFITDANGTHAEALAGG